MAKQRKYIDPKIRALVAANVMREMNRVFDQHGDKRKSLATAGTVKMAKSTVQRILGESKEEQGTSIDTLALVASKLGVHPFQLLLTEEQAAAFAHAEKLLELARSMTPDAKALIAPPQKANRGLARTGT